MRVTHQQTNAGRFGGVDHLLSTVQIDRHRLLDQNVFAGLRRDHDVVDVKVGRRCDVYRIDLRKRDEALDVGATTRIIARGELIAHFGDRLGERYELDIRMLLNSGQHPAAGPTKADDP
jgi:hypothetical protein